MNQSFSQATPVWLTTPLRPGIRQRRRRRFGAGADQEADMPSTDDAASTPRLQQVQSDLGGIVARLEPTSPAPERRRPGECRTSRADASTTSNPARSIETRLETNAAGQVQQIKRAGSGRP
jgi:hypothetical protein